LRDAQAHIFEKTGYNIELVIKEHQSVDLDLSKDMLVGKSDRECTEIFLKLVTIVKHHHILFIRDSNYNWTADSDVIKGIIGSHDILFDDGKKIKPYSKMEYGQNNILKQIPTLLASDDDFLKKKHLKNKYRIHYENGYYDMLKKQFVPDITDDTFIRLKREYIPHDYHRDHPHIIEIYDRLLSALVGPNGDESVTKLVLHDMARALAGCNHDKVFYILWGLRNSGKSSFCDALKVVFGNYITTVPNIVAASSVSGDRSLSLKWLYNLNCHIARLALSGEHVSTQGEEVMLDGNLIKSMISGGLGDITLRLLYGKEFKLCPSVTFLFAFNTIPKANPPDAMLTSRVIPFPNVYEDSVDTNVLGVKKPNPVDHWMSTTEWFIPAFEWIIYDSFTDKKIPNKDLPKACLAYMEEERKSSVSNLRDCFNTYFVRDPKGVTPVSVVSAKFHKFKKSEYRFWLLQTQGFEEKPVLIEGKATRCFMGFSEIKIQDEY